MSKVKAVVFDAGYTLLRPCMDEWFFPPRFFDFVDEKAFRSLSKEEYDRAFGAGYDYLDGIHDRVKTEEEELLQFEGFFSAFSRQVPHLGMTPEVCRALARDHTYNDGKFLFYDDVKDSLARLGQRYVLGVLSDTWPSLHRIFKNYGIRGCFSAFVLSCDVGVFKPDPLIYETLIRAIGFEPDEIVFVDDVIKNLQGAQRAGIRPVQILRKDFPRGDFPTVCDLSQLESYLQQLEQE
jgi:putative hydrolase of the HAD superfamily